MNEYRNIDNVVDDAKEPVMLLKDEALPDLSVIPKISDQVTLATDEGYSLLVEITDIADDLNVFKGKVIHGYYPKNNSDNINTGEMVEFSRNKIESIHQK